MAGEFENAPDLGKELGLALEGPPKRTVEIDIERYQQYLDDPDLTDAQKVEIVTALWQIITAFVDLGFGIHPVQEACGQVDEIEGERAIPGADGLELKPDSLSENFNLESDED